MTIISIEKINGLHPIQTWHVADIPDGWAVVPDDMVQSAFATCGYCEIEVEDGILKSFTATERPVINEPDAPPSNDELAEENKLLKAQIAALEAVVDFNGDVLAEVIGVVLE